MVKLTQSFEQWLIMYHADLLSPIMFGHTEVITEELRQEYLAWCLTDEGRQYLNGGSKYDSGRGSKNSAQIKEQGGVLI